MAAEHGQECRPLEHAGIVLTVCLVLHTLLELSGIEPPAAVVLDEERAHINRPIGIARGHIVQSGRYLLAERLP